MAKKQKQSLEQWCQDNDREDLLREWEELQVEISDGTRYNRILHCTFCMVEM